ncbi:hypothetical protein [Roseovarius confluentis]|uniref:hypothetical protein n=1 Tax=Roseovarius confluentis TaxID=1852027 RepID=UPI003BA8AD99
MGEPVFPVISKVREDDTKHEGGGGYWQRPGDVCLADDLIGDIAGDQQDCLDGEEGQLRGDACQHVEERAPGHPAGQDALDDLNWRGWRREDEEHFVDRCGETFYLFIGHCRLHPLVVPSPQVRVRHASAAAWAGVDSPLRTDSIRHREVIEGLDDPCGGDCRGKGAFLPGRIDKVAGFACLAFEGGGDGGVIVQRYMGEKAVAVAEGHQCLHAPLERVRVAGGIMAGDLGGVVHFGDGLVRQRDQQGLAAGEMAVQGARPTPACSAISLSEAPGLRLRSSKPASAMACRAGSRLGVVMRHICLI